ncbi:MAG: LptF/LptG family permease [Devosia sp.]|uniref:LptF/LptG family permease n=1 Tax=Devosia sp. TaxID=1871048 RepID=UPI001AC6E0EA|nr:LptF/LptG family permease [Devosia sp.]MBN9309460.1 LptF/LptG family permease [Devosia sp.]MBN9316241.1 LptF/LptG family permease [Devosia sp.]
MNRIDWVVVRRLLGSVGLTLVVLYGIAALAESLNLGRFNRLSALGGPPLAITGIVLGAARWMIDTLPFTFLVGAIAGLLSLQSTREMTVIKASGLSVWRVMKAPLAATILGGLLVALVFDSGLVWLNRSVLPPASSSDGSGLWLDERRADIHYILEATATDAGGTNLKDVTVFLMDQPRDRIEAPEARLEGDAWVMPEATRHRAAELSQKITDFHLPTSRTAGDMRARLSTTGDLTVWELAASLASRLNDPGERAAVETRFLRLIGLPLSLCGSLVIAFAFTAGYRRTNKYGGAVLYGIVLGVLVYVVSEMAGRAGGAGVMHPAIAVAGPAVVAIVIGVTVLLNREDGRT